MAGIHVPPKRLEDLPAEVIMRIFDECNDFKQVERFRRSNPHFFNVFQCNSSAILTNMARRTVGDDAVELAKEILVYQRHSSRAVPDYPAVRADLWAMQASTGSITLQTSDIQQFHENQKFYARFKRYYRGVVPHMAYKKADVLKNTLLTERQLDHRLVAPNRNVSVEYDVVMDITTLQFYKTWLLIWRFKHQNIAEFSAHEFISPEETGQLHFIAFVMEHYRICEKYIVSDAPARVPPGEIDGDEEDTARLAKNTARILTGWHRKSFMGVWYPLKSYKEGIFSTKFLEGAWKAVVEKGLKGFMYFRGGEWGDFTPRKGGSHLIYWKMLCHLAIVVAEGRADADAAAVADNSWHEEFLDRKKGFDADFEKMTTVQLIEKYKLE